MNPTAQAIVFSEINKVELRTVLLPQQGDWDLTVEMEFSAISLGTERWALAGKRPAGDTAFPCIPGYLSVGKVVGGGPSALKAFRPGERINWLSARIPEGYGGNWMCGHLNPAVVNVDPANRGGFFGMPSADSVPEGVASEEAALAGLSAVACRGIDMANIEADEKVVVVGQGVIGHAAAQICRLKGAKVLTADTMPSRVEFSRQLAADVAVNSQVENLAEKIAAFTEGAGADVVIDTTGSMAMLDREIDYLKPFGKLVCQGWYPPPNTLNFHKMHMKLPQVFYPCGHSGKAVDRCMRWMQSSHLKLRPLITHRFKPEQAVDAYELMMNHPEEAMAIVFDWSNK